MHISWRKRISRTIRGNLCSLKLSGHGIGVATQTKNGLLVVDPRDFGVSRSLLSRGSYDWTAISWLLRVLDQRSRMVFVGAHLGAVLVPLALQSGSRNIVAFEPNPPTHRLLEMNLALNGLTGVKLHRLAVGDSEGSIRFTQNRLNSGNSRVTLDPGTSHVRSFLPPLPTSQPTVTDVMCSLRSFSPRMPTLPRRLARDLIRKPRPIRSAGSSASPPPWTSCHLLVGRRFC
jgi:FkbM family methyltransferase